jgi:uncharacterized protein YggE
MAAYKEFTIDVKGEVEILLPAERAILSVQVNSQSQNKKQTTDATVSSARKVETFLRETTAPKNGQKSPVDHWSRTSLSEYTHTPYDSERKVYLPREYQATVEFHIRLQTFSLLGKMIHDLVAIDYVRSNGVEWVLTNDTMESQKSKLRTMAAKEAFARAQDYAKAVGYEKVTPLEIKENQAYTRSSNAKSGRIPSDGIETQSKNMADAEEWEDLAEEAFQYTPEEVKMTQSVSAKFRAE